MWPPQGVGKNKVYSVGTLTATFAGNATANHAVAHGCSTKPPAILIYNSFGEGFIVTGAVTGTGSVGQLETGTTLPVTAIDDTYFYVGNAINYQLSANLTGRTYSFIPIVQTQNNKMQTFNPPQGIGKNKVYRIAVLTQNYVGNSSANKAVAHSYSRKPSAIFIYDGFSESFIVTGDGVTGTVVQNENGTSSSVTSMDTTNFYVGNSGGYIASANLSGRTYYWVAIV